MTTAPPLSVASSTFNLRCILLTQYAIECFLIQALGFGLWGALIKWQSPFVNFGVVTYGELVQI